MIVNAAALFKYQAGEQILRYRFIAYLRAGTVDLSERIFSLRVSGQALLEAQSRGRRSGVFI